ncbi:LVIVD repeat-containing protein [Marinoscillum furvescens]|uniref:LVIVD repeat-containing protein n=1 Tax=Marinoscillum furvescens DSM 4134 TaxID=1122208 RepID=A0A3D9L1R1_MARFU|nr:hypothetical protein [Marinoscillum furvescens]RED97975.1 LVIVD repeat-containing protein [Marinoscillum furvescens DSM 4134]
MKRLFWILSIVTIAGCMDTAGEMAIDFNETGVGGSTARFSIAGDFLYVVNDSELQAIDISDERNPKHASSTSLGWGIETIFGYDGMLFIGGQTGMQIYGIQEDGSPVYVSDYTHSTACDPVIANDQYAYVTIRSGEFCNNIMEVNNLLVLDISNIRSPQLVAEIPMTNPRGLAFFKGDLFVGEGQFGLVRFSLEDPSFPRQKEVYDIPANDMIPLDNTLIITRDEGIFQFGCEEDELLLYSPLR